MQKNGLDGLFLEFSAAKLEQLTGRIQDCLAQLPPDQIWARSSDNENAVGNLVLHLCGNVRQWVVAAIGGAPDLRARDAEFAARGGLNAQDLSERLRRTVTQAQGILSGLTADRLLETVHIQGYDTTVLQAVYHVVEHFSQHTGQIIYATKLATGEDLGFYRHLNRPAHSERIP
jgi:uncharacterized damage-inducible protein DinB